MILAFAKIVVRGANPRPFTASQRIVGGMKLRVDPAIVAHLDHPRRRWTCKHRMLTRQLFGDLFDGGFHPKQ